MAVRILHPARTGVGPLEAALLAARLANAARLAERFRSVGVDDVSVVAEADDSATFGERLRRLVDDLPATAGLVVLGSGSVPLATSKDLEAFVGVAASGQPCALANNRYSADIVAIGATAVLRDLPALPGDNALPRWLAEVQGFEVSDLRDRWTLAMDLDSPLDVLLAGGQPPEGIDTDPVRRAIDALRATAADSRAELLIAGRTSAATVAWLERSTAARVRAILEERGLRAATRLALGPGSTVRPVRPPRSVLGLALDHRGPAELGAIVSELGDAAILDSRVLLAHRLGADEAASPAAEDRFASDLLLPQRIVDPWLRQLTAAAVGAPIPILLGGHSLVGPGIRLLLGERP